MNKNTDCYALAQDLYWHNWITERSMLTILGIKNHSARISDLKKLGLPIETVFKKVVKRNGRTVKVINYYQIKKGCIGKYKKIFKELCK